ncbi:MAG: hypothetical protein Q9163_004721 [Psora crenata]
MNTFANEAPGSPPGLTASKSSRSSTNRSSSISGTDCINPDDAHFEDIGLDDEQYQPYPFNTMSSVETTTRPLSRLATNTMGGAKTNTAALTTMRDLTNQGHTPVYARPSESLKGHAPTHSLSLPYGGPRHKGMRNASTPSLAITAMSNYNRSRSPSPQSPIFRPGPKPSSSPRSPRRPGFTPAKIKQIPARHGSWQPSKKSIEELEAEYNDLDEDLPEDASLWNVPLSPRPPSERNTPFLDAVSPKTSPGASPERPSPLRTSVGWDGTEVMASKSTPVIIARHTFPAVSQSPPSSQRSPRKLVRGASTGTLPDHSRTKSWNMALSELSDEAKDLTVALEGYEAAAETKYELAVQNREAPGMIGSSRAKKSSSIEPPPLKLNDIMVDPLPISKEKEKVLSRTRPSWLPPKNQKEEKKHVKEYQRMMASSLKAERRMAAKKADYECANDNTKSALLRIWEEHVLPHWDQVIREPRTRELWWRGVAPKSRAQVWQQAIGNDLALTEVTYERALQRAKAMASDIARDKSGELYCKEKAWFDAIHRDIKHTLPEINIFQPDGPLHNGLVDVLMAYSMYRSDVGYCHGTHLVAAFLSLIMATPCQAFLTLSNLLNRPLPLAFLTGDSGGMGKAYGLTLSILRNKYPRLHNHLFGSALNAKSPMTEGTACELSSSQPLNLSPALILEPIMRTLFLGPGQGLGIDIAARVWDVMVFEGDAAIIRTTVALLGILEGKLYGDREDVLGILGWGGNIGQGLADEEAFMAGVRSVGRKR